MPDVPDSDNNPFSILKVSQIMLFQQHSLPFVMETAYLKTITDCHDKAGLGVQETL